MKFSQPLPSIYANRAKPVLCILNKFIGLITAQLSIHIDIGIQIKDPATATPTGIDPGTSCVMNEVSEPQIDQDLNRATCNGKSSKV